jgi:hypothetical protein
MRLLFFFHPHYHHSYIHKSSQTKFKNSKMQHQHNEIVTLAEKAFRKTITLDEVLTANESQVHHYVP